ncbi:MAG TPA: phosphatase PAP2 family protein [Candidatus Kapabacteria bacterium]|nr:phosphatase PAP2 family protein [Candidatus Kapabacteria bacterium]
MRSRIARGERRRENGWQAIRASLWSTDYLALGMLVLYTLLDLVFIKQVKSGFGILQINIFTIAGVIALASWYDQTGNRIALLFRSFYILPVGYMMYSQVHNYIPLVHPQIYDATLASWDLAIFGVYPTVWITRFATPAVTEYFQIWYNLFQIMLVVPAVGFYAGGQMRRFRSYAMMLMLGFYLSYLLYFVMPAIGPRFQLHDFHAINTELPGVFLTQPFRELINAGNGIVPEMKNPYDVVNRDCMPSGHTMLSLLGILLAWRYRSRWRWFITIGGISVMISTVYLRYHYAVDLMAGIVLALIVFVMEPWIVRLWRRSGIQI